MITVSFGESIRKPDQIFQYGSLEDLLKWQALSEKQESKIEDLQNETDPDKRKLIKNQLPYIVGSVFQPEVRKAGNLKKSNLMIFDVDKIVNVEELFGTLKSEPFVCFIFRSPSGNGIKFGVKLKNNITDPELFSNVYKYASKKLSNFYNIELDKTSDCSRACYLGHDPDYFYNPNSVGFPLRYDVEKPIEQFLAEFENDPDIEIQIIKEICQTMSVGNYNDWVTCAAALATLGGIGENMFITLSTGKGYKDSVSALRRKFKSFSASGGVQIGSFFHIAQQNEVDIKEIRRRYYGKR